MTTPELERYKRRLDRERRARKELELIAESRARELYEANLKLAATLDDLTNQARRLEELSVSPIFSVDSKGLLDDWNSASERITGFQRGEVIGRDLVAEFTPQDCQASLREMLDEALTGKQTNGYELQLLTKNATRIHIMLNSNTRRDANGNIIGVLGVGQDITELRQTQAQVIQASKLATLGEMATSVAHELNQPLNIIRMASNNCRLFVQRQTDNSEYVLEKLDRIEVQTERAAAIIDHMRIFGRRAHESAGPIDPRVSVSNALKLSGEQLRIAGIELIESFPDECSTILGHQIHVEQVVMNLVSNARDALLDQESARKRICFTIHDEGDQVRIDCEDSGPGIPRESLPRIFEPFYTTKPMGKGTGLGLSVSYGIIRDMGGQIAAENTAEGARFSITLPACKSAN